jgi:signal transduction histidine kinase
MASVRNWTRIWPLVAPRARRSPAGVFRVGLGAQQIVGPGDGGLGVGGADVDLRGVPVEAQVLLGLGKPIRTAEFITVTNSGPLMPESAVAYLFEPLTRLDGRVSNRRGVGLGPSIVTSVVTSHHGQLHAEALPSGGMTISARLPTPTGGVSVGRPSPPYR